MPRAALSPTVVCWILWIIIVSRETRSGVAFVFFLFSGPSSVRAPVHCVTFGSIMKSNFRFDQRVACVRFRGSRCVGAIIEKNFCNTPTVNRVYGVCTTTVRPRLVRVTNESCVRFEPKTWLKKRKLHAALVCGPYLDRVRTMCERECVFLRRPRTAYYLVELFILFTTHGALKRNNKKTNNTRPKECEGNTIYTCTIHSTRKNMRDRSELVKKQNFHKRVIRTCAQ